MLVTTNNYNNILDNSPISRVTRSFSIKIDSKNDLQNSNTIKRKRSNSSYENYFNNLLKTNKNKENLNICSKAIGCYETNLLINYLNYNYNISKLIITECKFDNQSIKILSDALKENKSLRILNIEENKIGLGVKYIAEALKDNRSLQELNLNGNSICYEGAKSIAEALKENKSLRVLNICNNNIESGSIFIGEALENNIPLIELNISNNNIGIEGGKSIGNALSNNTNLKTLFIGNNNIGIGSKYIFSSLISNKSLEFLWIEKNNICFDKKIKKLYLSLNKLLNITELNYDEYNNIEEISKMNELLYEFNLNEFNIFFNENKILIKELLNKVVNSLLIEVPKSIEEALKKNTTLKTLNLSYNNLGYYYSNYKIEDRIIKNKYQGNKDFNFEIIGINYLCNGLKNNTSLKNLKLTKCNIGIKEVHNICYSLINNNNLRNLNLNNNPITTIGLKAIKHLLKSNVNLEKIHLRSNNLEYNEILDLIKSLIFRNIIITLDLSSNSLENNKIIILRNLLKNLNNLKIILDKDDLNKT